MSIFDFLFGSGPGYIRGSISSETEEKIMRDWAGIRQLLTQKGPSQLKQALITADKSLDNALKDFVAGESMGERLKNAKHKFDPDTYGKIWSAHKLRNNLVHESGFEPSYFVVTEAVEHLRLGLKLLGLKV